MYISKRLCQKHYFRMMRNGTFDLKCLTPSSYITPEGYRKLTGVTHPAASPTSRTTVFEHRAVAYDARNGVAGDCEICGDAVTWETCHVDHINENKLDNRPENLRITCRKCNVCRSGKIGIRSGCMFLTFEGETKTAHDWARDHRVKVTGTTIRRRKRSGMTDEEALFSKKMTHTSKPSKKPAPKLFKDGELVR